MDPAEPADGSDGSEEVSNLNEHGLSSGNSHSYVAVEGVPTDFKKVTSSFKLSKFEVVHCPVCTKTCQGFVPIQNHFLTHFKVSPHLCSICQVKFLCRETLRQHLFLHCLIYYKCDCRLAMFTASLCDFKEHLINCHDGRYKPKANALKMEEKPDAILGEFTNYSNVNNCLSETIVRKEQMLRENAVQSNCHVGTRLNDGNVPNQLNISANNETISFTFQGVKSTETTNHTKDLSNNQQSVLIKTNKGKNGIENCTAGKSLLKTSHSFVTTGDPSILQSEDRRIAKLFTRYLCRLCDFVDTNKTQLLQHLLKHIEADTYMCTLCTYKHASPRALLLHMDAHVKKSYSCDKCDFVEDEDQKFFMHYVTHLTSEEVVYSCSDVQQPRNDSQQQCKRTIKKKKHSKLSSSSKTYQKKESAVKLKNRYFCSNCPKSYRVKAECIRHEGKHTGNPSHICEVCGKQFFTRGSYIHHAAIHVDRTFMCDLCGLTYASVASLHTHHLTVHEKRANHLCPICGKGFPLKVRLTKHMRIHTGVKPYTCEFCKKMFNQKGNLAQHKRLHTGERPYQCEHCNKRFALRAAYTQHVRVHTGMKVSELKRRNAAISSAPLS